MNTPEILGSMNRKLIVKLFFISFLSLLFGGCEKEEPKVENKPEIILTVQYAWVNTNDIHPDVLSKVYIYYGLLTTDVQHYKLNESKNGVLYHERDNSKVIKPDSVGVVDINGKFSMHPDMKMGKILFQIESNYYKNEGFRTFLSEDLTYHQDKYRHSVTFRHWIQKE